MWIPIPSTKIRQAMRNVTTPWESERSNVDFKQKSFALDLISLLFKKNKYIKEITSKDLGSPSCLFVLFCFEQLDHLKMF